MAERFLIPVYLPVWLHQPLRRLKRFFFPAAAPPNPVNIEGDRNVEWTFISAELPEREGTALEFGCEAGYLSLFAARKGYRVVAVDLEEQRFTWYHPAVEFRAGDFLKLDLPKNHFDVAINCSSVEHVGIPGRYGITEEQSDGDIEVMRRLAEVLKPGGILLMTAPCGQDAVMAPWHRVYGPQRLPRLLAPFGIEKECYWVKDSANRWVESTREDALAYVPRHDPRNPLGCSYALSCFVLRKASPSSANAPAEGAA